MKRDFREHVFTATGAGTNLRDVSMLEVFDNLAPEFDRLAAIAELLETAEELQATGGIALLLKDIARRSRTVLELAVEGPKRRKRPG